jgi:uncharacterized protein
MNGRHILYERHFVTIDDPRFAVDAMLGSLAKWLRIIGFDTLYFREIDDNELVRVAKQEGRILLTRDSGICRSKKTGTCLLVRSEDTISQIREVLMSLGIRPGADVRSQRCASCNGELLPVDRGAVFGDVPEYVFRSYGAFVKCGQCGKVYWEGSHKKMINAIMAAMTKDTEAC